MRSDILLFERMSDLARDISFDEKKLMSYIASAKRNLN